MPKALVKNWKEFQHYKDRSPPWLKLHKTLLDDFSFQMLPIASKALAPMLWLLASENNSGEVDIDLEFLAFRLRWTKKDIQDGLTPLIEKGFLIVDSVALASSLQDDCLEAEAEAEAEAEVIKEKPVASPSGSRLPKDWKLPDEWKDWAKNEKPSLNADEESEKFRDYWHSKAGKDGRKADWKATWRNWIRNARVTNGHSVNGVNHGSAGIRVRKEL